jgi:hypothetical protein
MSDRRTRGARRTLRGSARWLALPLALWGCEHTETTPWIGTQDCTIGILPEQSPAQQLPPVSIALSDTQFVLTGDAFYLENFVIGPIADFTCEPLPFLVTAHPTQKDLTQTPEARPLLARAIALDPFDCRSISDGRIYTLTGTGQLNQRSAFFNMTFSAWIGQEQATLTCTTRFVQPARADAGPELPTQGEMQTPDPEAPPGGEDPGVPPFSDPENTPDAGSTSTLDPAG